MEQLKINKCTTDEFEEYQAIARQTFIETYEKGTDPQQLKDYMQENFSDEVISEELTGDKCAVFFLHDDQGKLAGYAKLRWDTTHELLEPNAIELQRIYVVKEHHNKGYGKILLSHAEQYARENKFDWIWLCVWYENHGAIRFYERAGWEKFGMKQFKFGDGFYMDPVFRKKL